MEAFSSGLSRLLLNGSRNSLAILSYSFCVVCLALPTAATAHPNGVILQGFDWHSPADGQHWNRLSQMADDRRCRDLISAIWIPPPFKGAMGPEDVGYALYDRYDLGEFYQKGSIRTKYGSWTQLRKALDKLKRAHFQIYADMVMNHMLGAEETERLTVVPVASDGKGTELTPDIMIDAWVKFRFPNRRSVYSRFEYDGSHFLGVDYAENLKSINEGRGLFKLRNAGHQKDRFIFDFAMGAKLNLRDPRIASEMKNWGRWLLNKTGIDGFRIDAAKHMPMSFIKDWLKEMRGQDILDPFSKKTETKELFSVAEIFDGNIDNLKRYLEHLEFRVSLFDFPLRFNFVNASRANGYFDMSKILKNTLVERFPVHAVTFVDSHDTQWGQMAGPPIADWFKPHAYALILLREGGYPTIFSLDYFGSSDLSLGRSSDSGLLPDLLTELLKVRKNYNFGETYDYFDDRDIVGWVRRGYGDRPKAMAVVLNDNRETAGSKRMFVGSRLQQDQRKFEEITGAFHHLVSVGESGYADFPVSPGSISVWIER